MGSEGPSVVTVHVTGFKKFHGVAQNPTETIVSNLKGFLEKKRLPKGLVLGSCTVLETAGQGGLAQLYQILESALRGRDPESSNSGQVIWVSFYSYLFLAFALVSCCKIQKFKMLDSVDWFYVAIESPEQPNLMIILSELPTSVFHLSTLYVSSLCILNFLVL